jgi:hypothetical protein
VIVKSGDVPFQDTTPAKLLVIVLCRSYMMMDNPRASDHAMIQRSTPPIEEPHTEPEIIPPDRADGRSTRGAYVDVHGTHRIYVARLGPFGIILAALVIAILTAVILFMLLGAALILLPVVALLVAVTVIAGLLRR